MQAKDGTPYSGKVNTLADTGETITDLDGTVLPKDPNGYDPEGLVALRDGTFWVSDEYGPFITHFTAKGRAIERLSPYDGTLPAELKYRVPNKGMEGLTVTPDGKTLVGIMQSALQTPDLGTVKPSKVTTLRIVTVDLRTRATHEYLYLLDNPDDNSGAVSEIAALSAHVVPGRRARRQRRAGCLQEALADRPDRRHGRRPERDRAGSDVRRGRGRPAGRRQEHRRLGRGR